MGGESHAAEAAYEATAPIYDEFTAHHDYELWLGNLLPKVEEQGLSGDRLLDVACGTGKSFIPMIERGWKVTACDLSPAMVAAARAKVGPEVELAIADMRELPKFGEFDLVTCLDDAVNYLLSVDELRRALAAMRANLKPTGRLMFDANTIVTYRGFFAEEVVIERGDLRLIWHGHASHDQAPGSISEATLEAEPLGDAPPTALEPARHRQRHFTEAEIRAALAAAGLECLAVWGHTHDTIPERPLEEDRHTKGVYIAAPAPSR